MAKPNRFIILITGLWVKFLIIVLKRYFISFVLFCYLIILSFFSFSPQPPKGGFKTWIKFAFIYSSVQKIIKLCLVLPPGGVRGVKQRRINYSYLKASTGFLVADLQHCQLTVNTGNENCRDTCMANIHQLIQFYRQNFEAICALRRRKQDKQL